MPDLAAYIAGSIELAMAIVGAVLLWRFVLSPNARAERRPSPLPAWEASGGQFLMFLLMVLLGSTASAIGGQALARQFGLKGDAVTVVVGAAAQFGMLAGVAFYAVRSRQSFFRLTPPGGPNVLVSGAVVFLISLPVLMATAKAWEVLLRLSGLPVERQDLIGIFANVESSWMLALMISLAVLIAPITEELVFRAGLYRYFRTRIPRVVALVAPALFFAALHVNWDTLRGLSSLVPLVVLAVLFSIAYERTGNIGTPMVAHALFNLNTVALILSGVTV